MSRLATTTIGCWETTKAKLDRIAESRRWTLITTVDVLADEFAARNGIDLPTTPSGDTAAPLVPGAPPDPTTN